MLITDSRGIFDALTRSESPQLRLRSSRTGEEARGIKAQCAVSDARIHWVNTSTMLADSLTKTGYPVRVVMEPFLVKKRWRCTVDPTFESGRRRKARGAPYFNQEDLDEINPSTESVALDTLLQDLSLSEDVREIMRMKYVVKKIEGSFGACKTCTHVFLSANLDFDPELQHVFCWALGECRDSREFHVDRVFLRLC